MFSSKLASFFMRSPKVFFSSSKKFLAAIDQSTTGSKLAIFDINGELISQNLIPHRQITKASGWLEHDATEIIQNVESAIEDTLKDLNMKVLIIQLNFN